jgi:hypothetical protein
MSLPFPVLSIGHCGCALVAEKKKGSTSTTNYDPSFGPEAMSKIRIEDPLFSSILPGVADFIGELGNSHFSFRQHDVDVNDDCHVRLDSQVVLRFYLHGIL